MSNPDDNQIVVLASGNAGKLRELAKVLAPLDVILKPQAQFNVPDVEETGFSFVENAIIKARAAAQHTGLPSIADDSGIEVDHLNGAPGIYSARYSGAGDEANNVLLLQELGEIPEEQRSARFQCVLVYMRHALDPTPLICQASWEGFICLSLEEITASAMTRYSTSPSINAVLHNWTLP